MSLPVNSVVGDYRIVRLLGEGGMGEVYLAIDLRSQRQVALKMILPARADADFVNRFVNEARVLATVRHPNIVSFVDYFDFGGNPCLVMEYVEGTMLAERLGRRGKMSVAEALPLAEALGDAVAHLHERGVLHRDIKPANVLVTAAGQVKLLDFGIAQGGLTPKLTATGTAIGTCVYMPPERLKGAKADPRTDVWALGVILYEMVTGTMPFTASAIGELCDKVAKGVYTKPSLLNPEVTGSLEAVIAKCLKTTPRDRYKTATELAYDLRRLRAAPPSPVPPPAPRPPAPASPPIVTPVVGPPRPSAGARWAIVAGVGAGILAVVVAIVASLLVMTSPGRTDYASPGTQAAGSAALKLRIETPGMPGTQVFRDNKLLGMTPCFVDAREGEEFDLTLKHDGCADTVLRRITASASKLNYSVTMKQSP